RPPPSEPSEHVPWSSSMYRLCEEIISLRERNNRQHQMFEQALGKSREAWQANFNAFAADTQRAYQQLRQEVQGEKRISLALLNELLDISMDLDRIVAARPGDQEPGVRSQESEVRDQGTTWTAWAEAVAVQARKVQVALRRHGIHPYDAIIGSPYNPALHERVGSRRVDGMDPLRVAEQCAPGYASQQPEFVLRRPKVLVSE